MSPRHTFIGVDHSMGFFQQLPGYVWLFIVVIAASCIWMHWKYSNRIDAMGPTILTTLGIFGCFLGIAIGLLEFNAGNIQGSVPALISGIKTAFWASIVGIGAALTLKARSMLMGVPAVSGETNDGATVDDLA